MRFRNALIEDVSMREISAMPRRLKYLLGWLLLVPGFFVFVTPLPGGVVMMTAGFLLLCSASTRFRQRMFNLMSRYPQTTRKITACLGLHKLNVVHQQEAPDTKETTKNELKGG